jgi:hypothetical protein
MTIAWISFASTGILMIRYYTHLGRPIYILHILFSILVQLASIASFLTLIGYYLSWSWVSINTKLGTIF